MVLKATPTGSVTRTFHQLFSSDKLSMARKVPRHVALVNSSTSQEAAVTGPVSFGA